MIQTTTLQRTVLLAMWGTALGCLVLWGIGTVRMWSAQPRLAAEASPKLQVVPLSRSDRVPSPTPVPHLAPGDPVGTITIPRVGLRAAIVSGVSDSELDVAVGHFPETRLPGHGGNAAFAGHRDSVFRPLRRVHEGDRITLSTADGVELAYEVVWSGVVEPEAVWVLEDTSTEHLTLVTCHPFTHIGPAPHRFVVRARGTDDGSE